MSSEDEVSKLGAGGWGGWFFTVYTGSLFKIHEHIKHYFGNYRATKATKYTGKII